MKLDVKGFSPQTEFKPIVMNFIITGGGLGDYINFCAALEYVANELKYVKGRIIVRKPFFHVARFLFDKYPNWRIIDGGDSDHKLEDGSFLAHPKPKSQLLNATGTHLLDLGFNWFVQVDKPIEPYNRLPTIDYNGRWKWPELVEDGQRLKNYAVFTPGATTKVRTMPAKHFNELVRFTKDLGVLPVFLGKGDFIEDKKTQEQIEYRANFDADYDFSLGVDLRDKTTLLETTQIMKSAKFVLGLDNGLLHFAGTTEVPIIFGHNIASVAHRKIRRNKGLTIDISVDEKALPCIGCQSRMRFIQGHSFKHCVYGHYACLEMLFWNECELWKKAIMRVLSGA